MKARDIVKKLLADGWTMVRQESSHRIFKKDGVRSIVTVPGHDSQEVSPGVVSQIRRITGLDLR
jgi:predicted RNA binding protein YcfA (HicA-like mRNA interferase family)